MPDKIKLEEAHLKETWVEKDFEISTLIYFSRKQESEQLSDYELFLRQN